MAQPGFFIPKKALASYGRISVGRPHFSFPFQRLNAPLRSVSTDLLGAVLEKTTCKRLIPPTQDSGVTLIIIGVYFTLVKTCACKPLYFALKCSYLFLLSTQTVATFFRLNGLLRTVVRVFFCFSFISLLLVVC